MRSSPWLFPAIATLHLLGLAIIGGAVLVAAASLSLWFTVALGGRLICFP